MFIAAIMLLRTGTNLLLFIIKRNYKRIKSMLFIHPSIFYTSWSLEPVPASLGHKAGYDDQQRGDLLINSEQRNILLPHHVVLYIINKFPPC